MSFYLRQSQKTVDKINRNEASVLKKLVAMAGYDLSTPKRKSIVVHKMRLKKPNR